MKKRGEIHSPDPQAQSIDLPDDFWDNAELKIPAIKKPVNLRVDADILEFFKAGGRGYQTRMHSVLRSYVNAQKRRLLR